MRKATLFQITQDGEAKTIRLYGRQAWTLQQLMQAGPRGIAPIERPAPRWSGYVENLRKRGFDIDTEYERHDGPYPGRHGRYRLKTVCRVVSDGEV